jgi:hypothetical protein
MGAAPPSYEPQRRRTLRFAIGVTVAFALTQIVPWPINFLATVITVILLQDSRPMPLDKGILTILAAIGCIWSGFLLSLALIDYPAVLVLTFTLLLTFMYRRVLSTGVHKLVFIGLLVAMTLMPVFTKLLPELAYGTALSITMSFVIGWLIATMAFALMPPPRQVPPAHSHGDPGDINAIALNAALVAGTMLAIFLSFGRTDLVMMVYSAIFAMSLSTAGASTMGLSYLRSTLIYGSIATLVLFEILVMAPFLPLAIALFFLVIYVFGFNIFSHNSTAGEWASGCTAFIILLSGLLASDKISASIKVIDRLAQIGSAALFVALAFAVLEFLRRWRLSHSVVPEHG